LKNEMRSKKDAEKEQFPQPDPLPSQSKQQFKNKMALGTTGYNQAHKRNNPAP
jgi:hypothetical protein